MTHVAAPLAAGKQLGIPASAPGFKPLPSAPARAKAALGLVEMADQPVASGTRRLLIVCAALLGAIMEVLDISITNVAIPQMQGNLGATLSEIGWVNTGYIIANVIILPLSGWLSQRFGRRLYFAGSILVFTTASFFCGNAHSLVALVTWRVIQGLGGGGLLATGQVIMLKAFPPAEKGLGAAIFGMGVMIGPSLGPVLGGWLTDNYSWPWIFFVNLPFGIIGLALTLLYVPRDYVRRALESIDALGVTLLAVGMGSLQVVLEKGQEDDWFQSPFITTLAIMAISSLATLLWWELRIPSPVINLRVLRDRSLAAGSLYSFVIGVGLYSTIYMLPVFLQSMQGFSAFQTGLLLVPSALISTLSFAITGPLSQRVDTRVLVLVGAVFFGMGAYLMSGLTVGSGVASLYWPLMCRGASLGFLFTPLTVAALGGLRPEDVGEGSGMISLMRQLGGSVGIAYFSTLLTRRQNFHIAMVREHLGLGGATVQQWIASVKGYFVGHGMSPSTAHDAALKALAATADKQASYLSFGDAFLLIALAFLFTLPLILMFRPMRGGGEGMVAH